MAGFRRETMVLAASHFLLREAGEAVLLVLPVRRRPLCGASPYGRHRIVRVGTYTVTFITCSRGDGGWPMFLHRGLKGVLFRSSFHEDFDSTVLNGISHLQANLRKVQQNPPAGFCFGLLSTDRVHCALDILHCRHIHHARTVCNRIAPTFLLTNIFCDSN